MAIKIKRIYDPPASSDGYRVLVDRLWPRGISKTKAAIDEWLKDFAPSTELRQWFNHDPKKFSQFKKLYEAELDKNPANTDLKKLIKARGDLTLLYGAKDPVVNQAVVLRDYLNKLA